MIQRSLAAAVYTLFLLLTCDNWEAGFFWLFFFPSRQSLIHMPIIRAARGPSGPVTKDTSSQASLSPLSHFHYSLLLLVSFFLFLLSLVILSRLNYRSCSGRAPSPPSFHSSFVPSFHPFICLHFFSSRCQLSSVISAISFALFQGRSSSSIRII